MKKVLYLLMVIFPLIFSSITFALPFNNGSFETGVDNIPANPGFLTIYAVDNTSINSWTVFQGSIDYIGSYWVASDGSRSIDLNGYYAQGGISQTFDTISGQKYIVSFDLSGNYDQGPDPKTLTVDVIFSSGSYSFYKPATWSHNNMEWENKIFEFTAAASSSTLRFISTTGATDNAWGPALDNVRVTPVPEPGILILLGLSMVSIAGLMRWWKE
jgi:choice-of-anchor C domain-containing protein